MARARPSRTWTFNSSARVVPTLVAAAAVTQSAEPLAA
jgi:hypothetical protein